MVPPVRSIAVIEQRYTVPVTTRLGQWIAPFILMAVDYGMVVLALLSAYAMRHTLLPVYFPNLPTFTIASRYLYILIPFTYISLLLYERMYTKRLPIWQCAERVFKVCIFAIVLDIGIMYFTGAVKSLSRIFISTSWVLSFVFLVWGRFFTKRMMVTSGLWQKPVIIVGAGKTAELLAKAFEDEVNMGYKIVGLIEDNHTDRPLTHKYPVIGSFNNVEEVASTSGVQDVIIATPGLERDKLLEMVYRIQPHVNNVSIVPNLFGVPLGNMEVETLFNQKSVLLRSKNNLKITYNRLFKRFFDLVVGSVVLVLTIPIMLVLAIIIKLDSKGLVLHNAKRLGKNGEEFVCYKFRTMYTNGDEILRNYLENNQEAQEEWTKFAKLRAFDPRVTNTGKWLRKFSLDELPQIINVLKGEMSLVGPRPYLPREQKDMGYYAHTILYTTPGITGLWQVSGRNDIDFNGRLILDLWYVRNWSIWLDIVLLFKTISVVFGRKGAY